MSLQPVLPSVSIQVSANVGKPVCISILLIFVFIVDVSSFHRVGAVTCTNFDPTLPLPTVGDCSKLISIMRSFANTIGRSALFFWNESNFTQLSVTGPTFVQSTAFPNPIIIAFSTCSSAFGNTRSDGGLIEYCWDALADNINSILNGCIAPGIDPAGECASINGFWAMRYSLSLSYAGAAI